MTHGRPLPIPRPVPPVVDGQPNLLLRRADLDSLAAPGLAQLQAAATPDGPPLSPDDLWAAILAERRRMDGAGTTAAPFAVVCAFERLAPGKSSHSRLLWSHAQVSTWLAWQSPLASNDYMASCTGASDAAACLRLIPGCPPERAAALEKLLASPGYFGTASPVTGQDVVRIYAAREGEGAVLHIVFEPEPGGSFVVAERDADGVPTHYAALTVLHVSAAVRELVTLTGAEVNDAPTSGGRAWRILWP